MSIADNGRPTLMIGVGARGIEIGGAGIGNGISMGAGAGRFRSSSIASLALCC